MTEICSSLEEYYLKLVCGSNVICVCLVCYIQKLPPAKFNSVEWTLWDVNMESLCSGFLSFGEREVLETIPYPLVVPSTLMQGMEPRAVYVTMVSKFSSKESTF